MTIAAIGDNIHYHVFGKRLPVIGGKFGNVNNSFGVFPVDMKDGYHEHLGQICGITGGAGIFRQCGVANLIINHNVNRAAAVIAFKLR